MNGYEKYEEKELISLLKLGDQQAFGALYYKYVKALKCFIRKVAKSPTLTEDIVHDTFVKIWDNREQIDVDQAFKPYLYTIAKRHLLNLLKRAQHESSIIREMQKYTLTDENTTGLTMEYNESSALFREAMDRLPSQCREVFVRCRLQGLTYKQTAIELGIAESTVNNQMVKALKSIREFMILRNAFVLIMMSIFD